MLPKLLDALTLTLLLSLMVMAALVAAEPPQTLPLVKADYQRCATVHPGPLDKPHGVLLYPNRRNLA